jgi:restriction system protein
MTIPTYEKFIEPILRFLASRPDGAAASEVYEAAANALEIGPEDRQQLLPSATQPVFKNRAGWAHDRMKRSGLSSAPKRGWWQLTQGGLRYASDHPSKLSDSELQRLVADYLDVRLRQLGGHEAATSVSLLTVTGAVTASPEERLQSAVEEMRATIVVELVETMRNISPAFFEQLVLEVLHKLGYGASRESLQQIGRTGDGGIDGVISLDRLGLEKVCVQAKRWSETSVGRPEIQAFYGAIHGRKAVKGVFITLSTFTSQAHEFAKSMNGIVLVDGAHLAKLMIDFEVGVASRTIKVPKLDIDFFDEGA